MNTNIQIVTSDNVPLRSGTMVEAWAEGLYHQIVRVILNDGKGNVLLQRRGPTMEIYPNRWTDSASGHVDFRESVHSAAERELREEIGVTTRLAYVDTFLTKYNVEGKQINTFNILYVGRLNQDAHLVVDAHEVAATKWISYEELASRFEHQATDYTPHLIQAVRDYGELLLAD